jgi:hypothetical protein
MWRSSWRLAEMALAWRSACRGVWLCINNGGNEMA